MQTSVERNDDGWTILRVGALTVIVPTNLESGADERVEIRGTTQRLFVEELDGHLDATRPEFYR